MRALLTDFCVVAGLAFALTSFPCAKGAEPQLLEAKGTDLGGKATTVFVARDKETWNSVKQALGKEQMIPRGMPKGDGLNPLDDIDWKKQMIVAIFWGEMSFSGQGEKCWIETVTTGKEAVTIDCCAILWGGAVKHAYRAWPYHAKVVPRSDLPVIFKQTTVWKDTPDRSDKDKILATLKAGEWKQEIPPSK